MKIAKIISAERKDFKDNEKEYGNEYYGYVITTDVGIIYIGIDSYQQCCEDWGVNISTELNSLISKTLVNIEETDYNSNIEIYANSFDSEENMRVYLKLEFENDLPTYVLLYNIHNGYYRHNILINIYGEDLILLDTSL